MHESSGVDYRSPRQVATRLSRRYKTILVDPPTRWMHAWRRRLSARTTSLSPSLTRYSPQEWPRRAGLDLLFERINARKWRDELLRLSSDADRRFVIFDRPWQHPRIGLLRESKAAYYAHCDYTVNIVGEPSIKMEAIERTMLETADVAFAASRLLVERFSHHARRVVHLPCGFDADIFDPARKYVCPPDLRSIAAPRILLSGFISGRVDLVGLLATAKARPDWNFVILGGTSPALRQELLFTDRPADLWEQVCALNNVHYLGALPLPAVPSVVAACDIGLVPYCLNAFTIASSPLKIFEYLAMGKPVVSTLRPEPPSVRHRVSITGVGQSYVDALERELATASDPALVQARIASVRDHSMEARARTVIDALTC